MTAEATSLDRLRVLWLTADAGAPAAALRPDLELARSLSQKGIEIHVIAPAGSRCAQAAGQAGLTVIEFPPRGLLGRTGHRHIRTYCRDQQIQLVHLFDPVAMAGAIPALHDTSLPLVGRHARTGGVQRWNPFARLAVLNPRLDRVIATTETGRRELARQRDAGSVVVIRPGCELPWYEQPPANLVDLGLPPDAFAIAIVTDYQARKGIEYIVDAAQWLPHDMAAHFLLVGAGHENRSVLERISRSPLREHFHLCGPRVDAPRITAACAVSVRATLRGDGLSQAIMESMASGVPPIMTDAGGARELVVQGESGIIIRRRSAREIGNALAWLYEHPAQRIAMGQAARARIGGEFTLARATHAHLALYRALCRSA